jgi:uncharacterized protein
VDTRAKERPMFIPVGDECLFAVLHEPAMAVRGGFLFCHAFAEEKLWAHRVFVSFARRLASDGWMVLRIDFRGHGDSDRPFDGSDVGTYLDDARAGVAALRARMPGNAVVGMLGLRFGATIAAMAASESHLAVDRLILWDPIVKGAAYMQSVLRINLAQQLAARKQISEDRDALVQRMRQGSTVNIEGYPMSLAFFDQAAAVDLQQTIAGFAGRGVVVQIDPAPTPARKELTDLAANCSGLVVEAVVEEPFWKEIKTFYQRADALAAVTLRWLEQTR